MIVNSAAESPRVRWTRLLPAIIWALIILLLLLLPGSEFPAFPFLARIPHFDKLVHAALFLVLYALLWIGLRWPPAPAGNAWRRQWFTILFCVLYAALTELLQLMPIAHRHPDFIDWLAGAAGSMCGFLVFWAGNRIFAPDREK